MLHLAGFPLLIALVVLESLHIIESGLSYGVMVFVGVIVTVVMAIIYYLVFGIMAKRKKKSIYRQTIVSILVAFICLGGLWIAADVFLPDFLDDATSGTIFYEDLADDFNSRADVNKELLEEYINRNVDNGNLKTLSRQQYLDEGARNQEVMDLLKKHFESIDMDGYATFVGPWIDMADDERLTIPTLIHLIIHQRETKTSPSRQGAKTALWLMTRYCGLYWTCLASLWNLTLDPTAWGHTPQYLGIESHAKLHKRAFGFGY